MEKARKRRRRRERGRREGGEGEGKEEEEKQEKGNGRSPRPGAPPARSSAGAPAAPRGGPGRGPRWARTALTEAELADVRVVGPEQEQRDEQHGQPGEGAAAAAQPPPQRHPAALSAAHRRAAARAARARRARRSAERPAGSGAPWRGGRAVALGLRERRCGRVHLTAWLKELCSRRAVPSHPARAGFVCWERGAAPLSALWAHLARCVPLRAPQLSTPGAAEVMAGWGVPEGKAERAGAQQPREETAHP